MILSFEDSKMRIVSPLDPLEGQQYADNVWGKCYEGDLDNMYISSTLDDYVNLTIDGKLSWQSVRSCLSESGKHWKTGRTKCMKYVM